MFLGIKGLSVDSKKKKRNHYLGNEDKLLRGDINEEIFIRIHVNYGTHISKTI